MYSFCIILCNICGFIFVFLYPLLGILKIAQLCNGFDMYLYHKHSLLTGIFLFTYRNSKQN